MTAVYLWLSAACLTIVLAIFVYLTSKREWRAAAIVAGMFLFVWLPGFLMRLFDN
jgi:hypothetical protein